MNVTVGAPASTMEDVHKAGGALSLPFLVFVSLLSIGAYKALPHIVRCGPKALLMDLKRGPLLAVLSASLPSS